MVVKDIISAPTTQSDYLHPIKTCLRFLDHDTTNYIAARLKYFRESTLETQNFKMKIIQNDYVI